MVPERTPKSANLSTHPSPMDSWEDPFTSKRKLVGVVGSVILSNLGAELGLRQLVSGTGGVIKVLTSPLRLLRGINRYINDFDDTPKHW